MVAPCSVLNWAYFKNWERILEIFGYACRCFSKIQSRGCFCQLRFRWGNPSYEVTFHNWTTLQSKSALHSSTQLQSISKHFQAFAGILDMLLEQSNSGTSGEYIIKFISAGFCRLERICFTIKVTTQIHSLTQHTQRPMSLVRKKISPKNSNPYSPLRNSENIPRFTYTPVQKQNPSDDDVIKSRIETGWDLWGTFNVLEILEGQWDGNYNSRGLEKS